MPRYASNGRNLSAAVHAGRAHTCDLCGATVHGNGSRASHGRSHVRRGEAVEYVKEYGPLTSPSRVFVRPDDTSRIAELEDRGFHAAR